ncbi:MAG: hypothetical protein V1725_00125 [archaeon]
MGLSSCPEILVQKKTRYDPTLADRVNSEKLLDKNTATTREATDESVAALIKRLQEHFPQDWTRTDETETERAYKDRFDNYYPEYVVNILTLESMMGDVTITLSQRTPDRPDPLYTIPPTYDLKFVRYNKELLSLRHLTNSEFNAENSELTKKFFERAERAYQGRNT